MPKVILVFCSLLAFLLYPLFSTSLVFGADSSSFESNNQINIDVVARNSENQFVGFVHVASCLMTGYGVSDSTCFGGPDSSNGTQGGLITWGTSLLASIYEHPPLSTQQYLASVGSNLGLVPEAHAQVGGSGNSVISVIFVFWQTARNLAYILLTVVFIVIGVMILIGNKSGQSVVTIQSALPGLVLSLIMITFSYFLAALLTDIAFLGCYVVGYVFVSIAGVATTPAATILNTRNLLTIFTGFAINWDNFVSMLAFVYHLSDSDPLIKMVTMVVGALIAQSIGGPVGEAIGSFLPVGAVSSLAGVIGRAGAAGLILATPRGPEEIISIAVYLVLAVALFWAMLKLIMDLVKRYIAILFLTIFAPIQFLFAAFPGNGKTYESWIRNMLCQVLPFPAVFGAFYFASYFLIGNNGFGIVRPNVIQSTIDLHLPSLTPLPGIPTPYFYTPTNSSMPLFGGLNLGIITQIIGFGILLATPAIPDFICKMIGAKMDDVFGKEIEAHAKRGRGDVTKATSETLKGGKEGAETYGKIARERALSPEENVGVANKFGGSSRGALRRR